MEAEAEAQGWAVDSVGVLEKCRLGHLFRMLMQCIFRCVFLIREHSEHSAQELPILLDL